MDVRLVTCDLFPDGIEDDQHLVAAFGRRGIRCAFASWSDPGRWHDATVALVRTPWDYFERLEEFQAWADRFARRGTLLHSADVVRWNADKRYLLTLRDRGIPIVPTILVECAGTIQDETLTAHLLELGPEVVVKPTVSAGARGAAWFAATALPAARLHIRRLLERKDVLIQSAIPLASSGETSVLMVNGQVSHAVCKRPAAGDFRVQAEFGGTAEAVEPTAEMVGLAQRAWDLATQITGEALLYARVDVVPTPDGLALMELEIIEPEIFFRFHPPAADALAAAVAARL